MSGAALMWETSHMANDGGEPTPLQRAVRQAIDESGKPREHFDRILQQRLNTKGKPLYDIERGKSRNPSGEQIRAIADVFGRPITFFTGDGIQGLVAPDMPPTRSADAGEIVEIVSLDLSYAMGDGTNIDDYVESEPVKFDYAFIRMITHSPPHRLRLAKGIGDSMFPTLHSTDRVMIDTTRNRLDLDDRIYAITRWGAGSIKRLRAIGPQRVLVLSDNPAVPDAEIDAENLIIHGRVIWFGREV